MLGANSVSNQTINNMVQNSTKKRVSSNQFKATVLNYSTDNVIKELTKKFNIKVSVKSVSKDKQSVTRERTSLSSSIGSVPVMIAPNILNDMASNTKGKEYVEKTIEDFFTQQSALDSSLATRGKRATPAVIIFHSDGSWTESGGSEPTPESLSILNKGQANKQNNNLKQSLTEYYYKTSDKNNLQDSSNLMMNYLLNQSMNNLFKSSLGGGSRLGDSGAMNLMTMSIYKAYSNLYSKKNLNQNNLQNNNMILNYLYNKSY